MADHLIRVLLEEQQDISAHKPIIDRLLSTMKNTWSSKQVADDALPDPELDDRTVPANALPEKLAEYAREHYCLWLESYPESGEGSESGGSSNSWICVPRSMMPEQLPSLASSLILVPRESERPKCSNDPEEGAEIYFKPASRKAFDTARKEGMFAGYVPDAVLDTVAEVLKNCEPAQPESCPGVLIGCKT